MGLVLYMRIANRCLKQDKCGYALVIFFVINDLWIHLDKKGFAFWVLSA